MRRLVYALTTTTLTTTALVTTALATTMALTLITTNASLAQSIPHLDRLPPSRLQQFSRDLTPSSAQDFFNAGQTHLEKEIWMLTRQRSPLNEHLLTVHQGPQVPPTDQLEPPVSSPRN